MQDQPKEETTPGPPAKVRGRKRRFAKRWSRRFSIITIAIIVSLVVTFFTVDIGRISIFGASLKSLAESQASRYLERPFHIGRIVAYPGSGYFAFEKVTIEGPTKDARPFFYAERILVNVPWWTMFRKELFLSIDIYDWRMVVEKWPDGAHLPRLTRKKKEGEVSRPFPLKIKQLDVFCRNGEFIYDDHVAPWRVTGPNLEFALVRANNLNTYLGTAKFTNGQVKIQNFEQMSADFNTRFQINGGRVELKHIDLLTDGAETHLDGYVNFANWPDQEYRIQSNMDFNRMREIFFANADWRMSGNGRFNGIFRIPKDGKFDLSGLFKSDEAAFGLKNTEWRFGNLDGELQWASNRFIVKRADSDFLGGRLKLSYGLESMGKPGGATATLGADYNNVNLFLFTRQFGWTALEPQARMHGHLSMDWRNGHFQETMQGNGHSVFTAPAGAVLASKELPLEAAPIRPEPEPFQKFRPFGEFPIGGDTSYQFTWSTLDFGESWVATPTTYVKFSGHARGGEANLPFHVTSHDWQNSDRLFTAIMSNFNKPTGAIPVGGRGTFDGKFLKAFNAPRIEGHFEGDRMRAFGDIWGRASGDVVIENSYLNLTNGRITYGEVGTIATSGRFALGYPRADGGDEINATVRAQSLPIEVLRHAFNLGDWPVDAHLALADITLNGKYDKPSGSGTMRLEQGVAWGEPFDFATADLRFGGNGSVEMLKVVVGKGESRITGSAAVNWAEETFYIRAGSESMPLQELTIFRFDRAPLTGQLTFDANGSGRLDDPTWEITQLTVPDLYVGDEGLGVLDAKLNLKNGVLTFAKLDLASPRLKVGCNGTIQLVDLYDSSLRCAVDETSLDPYFKFVAQELPFNRAIVSGTISVNGPLRDTTRLNASAQITTAELTLFDYPLTNDQPIDLAFRNNVFRIDRMRFKGVDTQLGLSGQANVTSRALGLQADGKASLAVLQAFYPSLTASGSAQLSATLRGTFDAPELNGTAIFEDGRIRSGTLPGLSAITGKVVMTGERISIDPLDPVRAQLREGPVEFYGDIILDGYRPSRFNLRAEGHSLRMREPGGLQTTVNMDLALVGPVTKPVLQGDINVLRANYSVRVDPTRGWIGFLGGGDGDPSFPSAAAPADIRPSSPLALNIRIRAPRMPFVDNPSANTYIEGIANFHVTGMIDNPVITGRVEIPLGRVLFNGQRYTLSGSIDFSNPLKFEPYFDLTAEANIHATGQRYFVTVRLNGTPDTFTPVLNADPWLSEMQIVSLIMGESVNPNTVEQRNLSASQEEQNIALSQMGMAFILSPISSTVGGAIQKATTLSAQIVPMLGTESTLQQLNPTARIVLGRQVSSRVYVTYSRTLSGSQNEIILVEIEQNDRVSWVISRNEDKTFAVDFRVRYVVR